MPAQPPAATDFVQRLVEGQVFFEQCERPDTRQTCIEALIMQLLTLTVMKSDTATFPPKYLDGCDRPLLLKIGGGLTQNCWRGTDTHWKSP
jgi:hypothetical protein